MTARPEGPMDDLLVIDRPIEVVFAFATDHANDRLWKPFVAESRQVTPGRICVGTFFEVTTVAGPYRRTARVEVLEHDPPSWYVYRVQDSRIPFVAQLSFAPVASGTRLKGRVRFEASGIWRALTPLVKVFFRVQTASTFARLKRLLETG